MRTERGKIEGDLILKDTLYLYGMVTGHMYVADGALLELYGLCCRNLSLEEGAKVRVYGTVTGDIVNKGGRLSVYGVVTGNIDTLAGETEIDPNAIIRGEVRDGA